MNQIEAEVAELKKTVGALERRVALLQELVAPEVDPLKEQTTIWHEGSKVKKRATGRRTNG